MIKQSQPVVPPKSSDTQLRDFSQIIDGNVKDLFQAAHVHSVVTSLPKSTDGAVGDIYLVDIAGSKKIVVKFSDGWYSVGVTKI